VLTGLREGELLGLAWGDIDWTARQIYVRQQYTAGRFSELKTKASRRRVDLPGELVAELRRWRLQCPPGAHDLVFPTGLGTPDSPCNLLNRGFYPALRRAGLRKIRFHDLRHTYASLLIANGEHPKRIQALMGHFVHQHHDGRVRSPHAGGRGRGCGSARGAGVLRKW